MNKLWCTGYNRFEKLVKANHWDEKVPDDCAFISICDPDECIYESGDFCYETHLLKGDNVLNIDFYDLPEYEIGSYKGLTDEQGKEIVDFIKRNVGKDFYIHCHVGASRSQGIVVFMMETYPEFYDESSLNPDNLPEIPNEHVKNVLKKML